MKRKLSVLGATLAILSGSHVWGGPPVPSFDDNEPGIFAPMVADPNDPNDPDGWSYDAFEWGNAGHANPSGSSWKMVSSPFSDHAAACDGNMITVGEDPVIPCANATRRFDVTLKNDRGNRTPMDTTKDWVFSFDFQIDVIDSIGADNLFTLGSETVSPITFDTDLISVRGAGPIFDEWGGSVVGDDAYRFNIWSGPIPPGGVRSDAVKTPIEFNVTEGRFTVHYKAADQLLDVWLDDTLLAENLLSATDNYDVRGAQLGGALQTFENVLYDNVMLGLLASNGCGPEGPGANPPGDFNCDGLVDVADLGIVGANFSSTEVTYVDGDANLDGGVDVADLGIVGANWSAAQATGNTSALVPEPAILSLLAMSVLMVGRRRR